MRRPPPALLALACLTLAAPAAGDADERLWLDVERPYNGWVELGLNPLLPIWGSARTVGRGVLDVVVIVDVSRSTRGGSGADVNGDGHLGGIGWGHRRSLTSFLRHPQTSSDPEDSILHAELEAVRRLVETLDPEHTRVGIVTLRDRALIRSSIGNSRDDLLQTLQHLADEGSYGRTHMADGIRVGSQELGFAARTAGPYRDQSLILLSDGYPTVPSPESRATEEAIRAALEAREQGIRIYAIGLGMRREESRALREIARRTHGAYVDLAEPGAIIEALPHIDLRGVADVTVENRTTGTEARSLRVFLDGTFDAYVELREGKNRLVIKARGPGGTTSRVERFVYFERREPRTLGERRLENEKLARLRDHLRERTLRVEIDRRMESAREGREDERPRELRVETEN